MPSEKAVLRLEIKNRLSQVPPELFMEAGVLAAKKIPLSKIWSEYETVLLFMSTDDEIDTLPLLEAALRDNKKLFLPRVEQDKTNQHKIINFYRVSAKDLITKDDFDASFEDPFFPNTFPWSQGSFGILEPFPKFPLKPRDFPALIITPGLAFDTQGRRLGRGKGYYDRFLAGLLKDNRKFTAAGLCMDFQVLSEVPACEWDQKVFCLFAGPGYEGVETG